MKYILSLICFICLIEMGNHSYTIHFVYIVTKVRILTGLFLVNFGRLRKYNRTRILRSRRDLNFLI